MLDSTLCNKLSSTFLFRGVDLSVIYKLSSSGKIEICEFCKDEIIYSRRDFKMKVGFVLTGECEVLRSGGGDNDIEINAIKSGGSFGVLAVFSNNAEYPTTIKASKNTVIAFIDKATVISITKKNPKIAMNVITFLSERISFLNERLNTFSGTSTLGKLASYLLFVRKETGSDSFILKKTKASEAVGVGRASVYRALNELVEKGVISMEDKSIIIIDPEGLERISK